MVADPHPGVGLGTDLGRVGGGVGALVEHGGPQPVPFEGVEQGRGLARGGAVVEGEADISVARRGLGRRGGEGAARQGRGGDGETRQQGAQKGAGAGTGGHVGGSSSVSSVPAGSGPAGTGRGRGRGLGVGQLVVQETVGQVQLPLAWIVAPQVFPLPLGLAVST